MTVTFTVTLSLQVEAWSLSALEAFVSTLLTPLREHLPTLARTLLPPPLRRAVHADAPPTLERIEATATREHRRALARLERRGESDVQPLTAA